MLLATPVFIADYKHHTINTEPDSASPQRCSPVLHCKCEAHTAEHEHTPDVPKGCS